MRTSLDWVTTIAVFFFRHPLSAWCSFAAFCRSPNSYISLLNSENASPSSTCNNFYILLPRMEGGKIQKHFCCFQICFPFVLHVCVIIHFHINEYCYANIRIFTIRGCSGFVVICSPHSLTSTAQSHFGWTSVLSTTKLNNRKTFSFFWQLVNPSSFLETFLNYSVSDRMASRIAKTKLLCNIPFECKLKWKLEMKTWKCFSFITDENF